MAKLTKRPSRTTPEAATTSPKKPARKPKRDARADTRDAALARVDAFAERAAKAKAMGEKKARLLIARIRRLLTRIAEDFYDLALCFHELQTRRHWAALGYSSFEACVTREGLFEPEGARQMVAIIDAKVSREAALALGSYSAAYEALQLTKATPAPDTVDGLVESDATVAGTKIVGGSVRKLRAARLQLLAASGSRPAPPATLVRAQKLAKAITRSLAERASVKVEARAEPARPAPRVVVVLDVDAAAALADWLKKPG